MGGDLRRSLDPIRIYQDLQRNSTLVFVFFEVEKDQSFPNHVEAWVVVCEFVPFVTGHCHRAYACPLCIIIAICLSFFLAPAPATISSWRAGCARHDALVLAARFARAGESLGDGALGRRSGH